MQPLPIDPHLPAILKLLESNRNLVVQASPGSGKTTRIPPALLKSSFRAPRQEILVLVPRRLAAKMAAYRVAEEMGEEVGESVGYQFRFEKVMGPMTRLKFLTEGLLLRQLMKDPLLQKVSVIILDEFHERHLHTDVALSYLRWLQQSKRPDLKIIVMSATLEVGPLSRFLGDSPVYQVEAPVYPVKTTFLSTSPSKPLDQWVRDALKEAKNSTDMGDVLVFLPGMAEIRRSEETLHSSFGKDFLILPLHGDLPRDQQMLIFKKMDWPKVILATNIAESSLTIEGVRTVIDSGLHRQASFSWWSGVPALKTRPISQASAVQRSGRAGRTAPGRCFRLYTRSDFEGRPSFELPEIRRVELHQTLLEIKALGFNELKNFPWFEAPVSGSLETSVDLLFSLGALKEKDPNAPLTDQGRRMAAIPVHPRLSRLMIEAEKKGVLEGAAALAALLSEDELEGLDALEAVHASLRKENLRKVQRNLLSFFESSYGKVPGRRGPQETHEALAYAVLCGFPDRVAKKREEGKLPSQVAGNRPFSRTAAVRGRLHPALPVEGATRAPMIDLVFCQGGVGSVSLKPPVTESDVFVVLEVQERQALGQSRAKVHVRSLCPIRAEWLLDLPGDLLQEKTEILWEGDKKRVVQRTGLYFGQLTLSESFERPQDLKTAEEVFLRFGLGIDPERFHSGKMEIKGFLEKLKPWVKKEVLEEGFARLHILHEFEKDPPIVSFIGSDFGAFALKLLEGFTSLQELQKEIWSERILSFLSPKIRSRLEKNLPPFLVLPRGRRVKIHYELGQKPWIASRLQDFFGMKEGPSLMGGRLPLTLHLLAPNQRPVQVTTDLKSFWQKAYPEIRKELSRRYPRHVWPEDPLR